MYSFVLAKGIFFSDPKPNSIESITIVKVLNKDITEEQTGKSACTFAIVECSKVTEERLEILLIIKVSLFNCYTVFHGVSSNLQAASITD